MDDQTPPMWRVVTHARPTAELGGSIYELTAAELRVLTLLPQGLRHGETAALLHVSPHTVKRHAHNLARRWGVPGTAAALVKHAYRLGIVPLPDGPELADLRAAVADVAELLGLDYVPGKPIPAGLRFALRTRLAGGER